MPTQERDMDLIRKILFQIEASHPTSAIIDDFSVEGYDEVTVAFHVGQLYEAGLINAGEFGRTGKQGEKRTINWKPKTLTWDGSEFLESIRQDTVWNGVKQQIRSTGSAMIREAITLATRIVLSRLTGDSE